ncbi:recombinase family protein [Streptomyces sp. NPDC058280]|uniref:recombinase family protein n=1 Tax=Streptomyces sp. NPDC058280 TaxID=3346419 RepID=UPI0036F00EC3
MSQSIERPYDGCGRCLVGLRRLSRKTDATSSPERQRANVLSAVKAVGGHVIAWADDWEVSGATDPMTRPKLGPWLRGENGAYDGVAGSAVDRLGRNLVDCLNTGYMMQDTGKMLVTYGHDGPWDLNDPADENRFTLEAWSAQMELRAIQRRNQDTTVSERRKGRKRGKHAYGYRYVRLHAKASIDHVALDHGETMPESIRDKEDAAEIIRSVARRILADQTGEITTDSEAARLTRAGILAPLDHTRVMGGKEPLGTAWAGTSLHRMLMSEAALGLLMHKDRPVVGEDGKFVQLATPLWNRPTHNALVKKLSPAAPRAKRAQSGDHMVSEITMCGNCNYRMYRTGEPVSMTCMSRRKGLTDCRPAPAIQVSILKQLVTEGFLSEFGPHMFMESVFDPGNGSEEALAGAKSARSRLRDDREAGLYDDGDDAEWFRTRYAALTAEIKKLEAEPIRPAGMVMRATGRTVQMEWDSAPSDAERRKMLQEFGVSIKVWPTGHEPRVLVCIEDTSNEAEAARRITSTAIKVTDG